MIFRGVVKLLAVVVASAAVGAGLGIGLAKLGGDDGSSAVIPATTTATKTTSPRGARPARVRVVKAVLFPAATDSGRARQRARLSVRVRVTNRGTKKLDPGKPRLIVDHEGVSFDPASAPAAGAVLKPIAPGESATGELRFEISGAVTQHLNDQQRARLRIAGRNVAVKIAISSTPAPDSG